MDTISSTPNTYTGGSASPVTAHKEYSDHHHDHTNQHSGRSSDVNGYQQPSAATLAAAFGGALQPGLWRPYEHRKFANPAPLGLSAFALTTFVLSCVNLHARGVTAPNIAVPLAFGYGGLVQLLSGMWYVLDFRCNVLNCLFFYFVSKKRIHTPHYDSGLFHLTPDTISLVPSSTIIIPFPMNSGD